MSFLSAYRSGDGWTQLTDSGTAFVAWPSLSADGQWVANASNESAEGLEILVRSFPDMGPAVQVSRGGGRSPIWSRDGSEIFYRNGDTILAVSVSRSGDDLRADRKDKRRFSESPKYGVPVQRLVTLQYVNCRGSRGSPEAALESHSPNWVRRARRAPRA